MFTTPRHPRRPEEPDYMLESEKKNANRALKSTSPGIVNTRTSRSVNGSGMAMGELGCAKFFLPMIDQPRCRLEQTAELPQL